MHDFKGIGADIFCREAQIVWDELYPVAEKKTLATANRLKLGDDAAAPAKLAPRRSFRRSWRL